MCNINDSGDTGSPLSFFYIHLQLIKKCSSIAVYSKKMPKFAVEVTKKDV